MRQNCKNPINIVANTRVAQISVLNLIHYFTMSFYQKYKHHYRDNLNLAIPVVISQLGHTLVQTSDTVIVGHFAGTVSLAAVSLANSIFVIVMMIGIGISYGLTPLIAQHNGRKNYEECGGLLSNSLFINLVTGILHYLPLLFLVPFFLLDHLDQTPASCKSG